MKMMCLILCLERYVCNTIHTCACLYLCINVCIYVSVHVLMNKKVFQNQLFFSGIHNYNTITKYIDFYLQNATSFLNDYQNLLQQPQYQEYNEFGLVGAAYDAMWSVAIGLDIASKKITAGNDSGCENLFGELVPLEMFDYRNEKLGCIMRKSFDEVMFTGITVS